MLAYSMEFVSIYQIIVSKAIVSASEAFGRSHVGGSGNAAMRRRAVMPHRRGTPMYVIERMVAVPGKQEVIGDERIRVRSRESAKWGGQTSTAAARRRAMSVKSASVPGAPVSRAPMGRPFPAAPTFTDTTGPPSAVQGAM